MDDALDDLMTRSSDHSRISATIAWARRFDTSPGEDGARLADRVSGKRKVHCSITRLAKCRRGGDQRPGNGQEQRPRENSWLANYATLRSSELSTPGVATRLSIFAG